VFNSEPRLLPTCVALFQDEVIACGYQDSQVTKTPNQLTPKAHSDANTSVERILSQVLLQLSESRPLEKKYMSHLSQFSLSHGELCSCRTDEASVTAIWRRCCLDSLPGFMGCLPRLCLADNKFASRTGAVREDRGTVVVNVENY